jgi:hypothetical protein
MSKSLIKITTFLFLLFSLGNNSFAQCLSNQGLVNIAITPDNYPAESTWKLFANNIQIANGTTNDTTICVDTSACIRFEMHDSYGDGMCCNYGQGSYTVLWNGTQVATGGQFTSVATHSFNCQPGTICTAPITISTGNFTAPNPNTFYSFTPDSSGMYSISTCNLTACDTKLWIYDQCNNYVYNTDNTGTLFYNDDNSTCGIRADIDAFLSAGTTYIIRVGLYGTTTCSGGIPFSITYDGPLVGCMDPTACNYNPDATSAGVCYYYPNPNCPAGPDLTIVQSAIQNSLEIREEFATNCMVEEGCMNGYGSRTVLAFDTHIKNIGDMDYYIGTPANNPSQFSFQNCHGHAHYEGYAEYVLYTMNGQNIPIGHKNGFCVMDLECSDGGTAQYGCGNMGITRQCGDIYSRDLDCQWIDITDLDTAEYILAVKVNWDQSPDALGHNESNYQNNWAQVCVRISETNGVKTFTLIPNCTPYFDCAGVMYGNAQLDCNGNCNGTAKRGDLDLNGISDNTDVQLYLDHAVKNNLATTTCNDLSADGKIDVWDAGLLMNCLQNGASNNSECVLPNSVVNNQQTVNLGEIEVYTDFVDNTTGYMDIKIKNPMNEVKGYELKVSGATVTGVSSLIDINQYPAELYFDSITNEIACLSLIDSLIPKYTTFTPFLRVYLADMSSQICLDSVIKVLNKQVEPVNIQVSNQCVQTQNSGISEIMDSYAVQVYPNPARDLVTISVPKINEELNLSILDAYGKVVYQENLNDLNEVKVKTSQFSSGIYTIQLKTASFSVNKRFIKN